MDFEHSSQAKSWMFDETSLMECRRRAAMVDHVQHSRCSQAKVRKFASGFHELYKHQTYCNGEKISQWNKDIVESSCDEKAAYKSTALSLCATDQEILVNFHAHQIQMLVGPNAIFPELRRSASVLSTAIILFRRFYLSNSVFDFHPRNIAAASALLAVKVDCENKLEIGLLAHATSVVHRKAQNAPLRRDELRKVSIEEIEAAERNLLEGLNYELRCHHPFEAIRVLASDVTTFLSSPGEYGIKVSRNTIQYGCYSPHSVQDCFSEERIGTLCARAVAIAQSALVYSDINFLYSPGQIAFATVSIALEGNYYGRCLGAALRSYLRMRFPQKTESELGEFEEDVKSIIYNLSSCPAIDLRKFCFGPGCSTRQSAHFRAAEVNRVFAIAASIRNHRKIILSTKQKRYECGKKRLREEDDSCPSRYFKIARID